MTESNPVEAEPYHAHNPATAVVTGAGGFIGSHLVRRLVAADWEVHVIVRPGSNLQAIAPWIDRVIVHQHDGTTAGISKILHTSRPDVVFHLASLFLAQHRPEDIGPLITSNLTFGAQLAEGMAAQCLRRLVNTGTSWQHYENKPYSPVCLYAATKQAFESILQYYVETACLQVVHLKLFDSYGPGDLRPKLFSLLKKTAENQQTLAMSAGEQLIDLVHVDDIVDAFLLAADRLQQQEDSGAETFAVSSGQPLPLRELVGIYEQQTGVKVPIDWGARPYRPREVMVPWHSGTSIPGWSPRRTLAAGLRELQTDPAPQNQKRVAPC